MNIINIIIPAGIILIITLIAYFFYLTVGGIYLIGFGSSAQFIGFWVSMFSQRSIRIKNEEFKKLLEDENEKIHDVPYLQIGHNQWRFFMGWVIISIGFFSQMIGLFLPKTGLMFQN